MIQPLAVKNMEIIKRNFIVLLISTFAYWLAFQGGSKLIELYVVVNLNAPVLPIVLIEQSLIPLIMGYMTCNYLTANNKLTPLLVLAMPLIMVILSLIYSRNENGEFMFEPMSLFLTIISLQFIFVLIGSYISYARNE